MTELRKTPLHDAHIEAGAKLTGFAGWSMPVSYSGVMEEHRAVRGDVGLFDVSHMRIIDITGQEAAPFLRIVLANSIDKLAAPGRALYTCMLNKDGGILDDLLVYFLEPDYYRLVVNAATADRDLHWLNRQSQAFDTARLQISERDDLALLALQGPHAEGYLIRALASREHELRELKPFAVLRDNHYCIARTGYTGEDGFEIMLDAGGAPAFWSSLLQAGVTPCGLGARDTLRLEAGLCLYGQDMDDNTTPLECGLGWTVAWEPEEREFIGRGALAKQREQGVEVSMAGLVLDQRNVLRSGYQVFDEDGTAVGRVTSGTFSPTIGKPIGMARLRKPAPERVLVEIRGKRFPARVVKPVFVRQGRIMPGVVEAVRTD